MHAGAFYFTIEWIGLDEEPDPEAIERGINNAKNQPVEDVTD